MSNVSAAVSFDALISELSGFVPEPRAHGSAETAIAALLSTGRTTGERSPGFYAAAVMAYGAEPRPDDGVPCALASSAHEIALELRIAEGRTIAELRALRRRFAMCNHPDRVSAAEQTIALQRMAVANHLIDGAIRAAEARAAGTGVTPSSCSGPTD